MRCAWDAFINLLPIWLRDSVDKHGSNTLQELRLRLNSPPELITSTGNISLARHVCADDLRFCINVASRYSPWTAGTISQGYLTAPGGHRIGICGNSVIKEGQITGINSVTSLCMRVARDFPGIASRIEHNGSVLIIGKPGSGKTTLLRDLIRQMSNHGVGSVAVVDEREEIFPTAHGQYCFPTGRRTDILSGCSKKQGIDIVLRSMGPAVIALDEITANEDCQALLHAGWCGVKLLATAHAADKDELFQRPVYHPILENKIFDTLLILHPDKSWHEERLGD